MTTHKEMVWTTWDVREIFIIIAFKIIITTYFRLYLWCR